MPLNSQFCFLNGTRIRKMSPAGTACKRAKRCLHFTRSMFVHRREHKGPRPEARPRSMAAFYYFKAAVSCFSEPPSIVQGGPPV